MTNPLQFAGAVMLAAAAATAVMLYSTRRAPIRVALAVTAGAAAYLFAAYLVAQSTVLPATGATPLP